jgi:hypothetical protein
MGSMKAAAFLVSEDGVKSPRTDMGGMKRIYRVCIVKRLQLIPFVFSRL